MTVRVFLVDDMKQMRLLVTDLLSTLGDFRVGGAAATEAEAKLWPADHPDAWNLAILDLGLEQGSGIAVVPCASQARTDHGHLAVASDHASGGIRSHCEKLGADAVFLGSDTREFMDYRAALGGHPAAVSSA